MNEQVKNTWIAFAIVGCIALLVFWLNEIELKRDLKIEAVERGYAEYTDGKWGWLNE